MSSDAVHAAEQKIAAILKELEISTGQLVKRVDVAGINATCFGDERQRLLMQVRISLVRLPGHDWSSGKSMDKSPDEGPVVSPEFEPRAASEMAKLQAGLPMGPNRWWQYPRTWFAVGAGFLVIALAITLIDKWLG